MDFGQGAGMARERAESLRRRLEAKLRRDGECLIFTGAMSSTGYGVIGFGGRAGKVIGAHRAAYILAHGPIPPGQYVCHRCDRPSCCEPSHLFLGTQADNMADAAAKGRFKRRMAA